MPAQSDTIYIRWCKPSDIVDPALIDYYWSMVSDDERVKILRFIRPESQHSSLVTRALIRCYLSQLYPHIAPADWRFSKQAKGKPVLAMQEQGVLAYFNVTHTRDTIAIAVSERYDLGLDVEHIDSNRAKRLQVAKTVFTESEQATLEKLSGYEAYHYFYALWTLKEAFLKALGTGLTIAPRKIEFLLNENQVSVDLSQIDMNGADWQFALWDVNESSMALAWQQGAANTKLPHLDSAEFIPS